MSLTQPPPLEDDETDRPPSRRFKLLFGSAMLLIALGYTWVWHAKTERVIAEPAPVLAFAGATSYISDDSAGAARVADRLVRALGSIRGLRIIEGDRKRAQDAGATQLLFASHTEDEPGHRLELRRIDVAGDTLLHVYRVEGVTLDETVHRMAVQVAMSFGLPRPDRPPQDPGAAAPR